MKENSAGFRLVAVGVLGVIVISIIGWRQTLPMDSAGPLPPGPAFVHSMEKAIPEHLEAWKGAGSAQVEVPLALGELRLMFDNYLSAVGERNIATITHEIHAEIERSLAPFNVPIAKRILGLYLAFKRELLELERSPNLSDQGGQTIRNRMAAMRDLRARFFNADEIQAMFGNEDAYDMDVNTHLEISQDPSLTPEQKQDKLAALDASMPAELRRAREAQATNLDREEAQWTKRIEQYLTERNQLMETPDTAADPDHQAALLDLQRARFTDEERRRLPAYEQ